MLFKRREKIRNFNICWMRHFTTNFILKFNSLGGHWLTFHIYLNFTASHVQLIKGVFVEYKKV